MPEELEESLIIGGADEDASATECVRRSPLFAGLPASAARELAAKAIKPSCPNRQLIFRQGDPARHVHVIGSGNVKVTQLTESGSEVILRVDRPGSPIDDMDAMISQTHDTSAFAIGDCCILAWPVATFAEFAERFPVIQRNVTRILVMRIRMLQNSISDLNTANVSQRLARVLLRLTERNGYSSRSVGFSREELAQMVGTSTFMVSRFLAEWSERGVVHVNRQEIIIEDRATLAGLGERQESTRLSSRRQDSCTALAFHKTV